MPAAGPRTRTTRSVKDLDFACGEIIVRDGKGGKDRATMLPEVLHEPLQEHLQAVQRAARSRSESRVEPGATAARCP